MTKLFSYNFMTILLVAAFAAGCTKDNEGDMGPATDLSAEGTANCYIVPSAGSYKFKTVKGNSAETVGNPGTAVVLWESFGTDVKPEAGDIIKNVEYKDGYVTFTTPEKLNNGNAVIAVKDVGDNILWSWHIWVCKNYVPTKNNQHVYNNNAGIVMDRFLGATSAVPGDIHAFGLLYQWGRKDPFLGCSDINGKGNSRAASTIEWPSAIKSGPSSGTIEFTIAHPTTFITSYGDWLYNKSDGSRWQGKKESKAVYDPCPPGWKVPKGGSVGLWAKAFGTDGGWLAPDDWDSTNVGMDFAKTEKKLGSADTIWYPAPGHISYHTGVLADVGTAAPCWSFTLSAGNCSGFHFAKRKGEVKTDITIPCAHGASVRCVAE